MHPGAPRYENIKLIPGAHWGSGIAYLSWAIFPKYLNIEVGDSANNIFRGGFNGISDINGNTDYTQTFENVKVTGAHAAIVWNSDMVITRNLTVTRSGRYGFAGHSGALLVGENITFLDPVYYQTEIYCKNMSFRIKHLTANEGTGQYPSQAAIWNLPSPVWEETNMDIYDMTVNAMAPEATMIQLPYIYNQPWRLNLYLLGCRYSGSSNIASFIKSDMIGCYGMIYDVDPATRVTQWLDWSLPTSYAYAIWTADTQYKNKDYVSDNGSIYQCLQNHTAAPTTRPGTTEGAKYWNMRPFAVQFFHELPTKRLLPANGWVADRHTLTRTNTTTTGNATEQRFSGRVAPGGWTPLSGPGKQKPLPAGWHAPKLSFAISDPAAPPYASEVTLRLTAMVTDTDNDIDHVVFYISDDTLPSGWRLLDRIENCGMPSPAIFEAFWLNNGTVSAAKAVAYDKYGLTSETTIPLNKPIRAGGK